MICHITSTTMYVHVCLNVKVRKICLKSTGNMTHEFPLKGFDCAILIWPLFLLDIFKSLRQNLHFTKFSLPPWEGEKQGGCFIGRAVLLETIRYLEGIRLQFEEYIPVGFLSDQIASL